MASISNEEARKKIAALKAIKPINYFDNLESVDEMRTGMAVKSRDALVSGVRSGKIKIPGRVREGKKVQNPGGVHVADPAISIRPPKNPGDEPEFLRGLFERGSVDGSGNPTTEVDVAGWAWANSAAKSWRDRGKPVDDKGRARVGRVTIDGQPYMDGQMDFAVRASEGVARKNEIARKTYDVLKATGVYSPDTLDWAQKGRFSKDGVAEDISTKEALTALYMEGLRGLRDKYTKLSGQKELYGNKLKEAQDKYTKMGGYKGFDDFVARNADSFSFSKEWDAYDKEVQRKIWAAQARNNPSEVARLVQVADGRRVQMQEMAQKKAMSAWSGSGASNLWRAQKELEDTLANQQAAALKGMNAAMQSNAVLAKQLGVSAQSLLDKDNGSGDTRSFAEQLREAKAALQTQQSQPQQPGAPVANGAPSGGQAEENQVQNQTAAVRRKPREVESYE